MLSQFGRPHMEAIAGHRRIKLGMTFKNIPVPDLIRAADNLHQAPLTPLTLPLGGPKVAESLMLLWAEVKFLPSPKASIAL